LTCVKEWIDQSLTGSDLLSSGGAKI